MNHQLTPEFAETVQLPINPISRHRRVAALLLEPEVIGDGVHVLTDERVVVDEEANGHKISMYPAGDEPIIKNYLGRNALKRVANIIEWIDASVLNGTQVNHT